MGRWKWLAVLPAALLATACSEIDCPLENTVALNVGFYDAAGAQYTLSDTLTVMAAGTDSVLFNRGIDVTALSLPMSMGREADTLLLRFTDIDGRTATDSVIIGHTNNVHFENLDCPPAVFHYITSVRWTSHDASVLPLAVDRVELTEPNVNYDARENLKIYLRTP